MATFLHAGLLFIMLSQVHECEFSLVQTEEFVTVPCDDSPTMIF